MKRLLNFCGLALVLGILIAVAGPKFLPSMEKDGSTLDSIGVATSDFFFPRACAGVPNSKDILLGGGTYYCVTNSTVNSGVNYALSGTYVSTVAAGQWLNATSSTKTIIPDHIRLNLTGLAPASTSSVQYVFEVDSGARLPTANALTQTPVNLNPSSTVAASVASVKWHSGGAMTVPAATAASRLTGTGFLEFMLAVTGDEYELQFGCNNDGNAIGPLAANRTTSATGGRFVTCTPNTVIPPGWTGTLHLWLPGAATNIPAFEYRACWYEL